MRIYRWLNELVGSTIPNAYIYLRFHTKNTREKKKYKFLFYLCCHRPDCPRFLRLSALPHSSQYGETSERDFPSHRHTGKRSTGSLPSPLDDGYTGDVSVKATFVEGHVLPGGRQGARGASPCPMSLDRRSSRKTRVFAWIQSSSFEAVKQVNTGHGSFGIGSISRKEEKIEILLTHLTFESRSPSNVSITKNNVVFSRFMMNRSHVSPWQTLILFNM